MTTNNKKSESRDENSAKGGSNYDKSNSTINKTSRKENSKKIKSNRKLKQQERKEENRKQGLIATDFPTQALGSGLTNITLLNPRAQNPAAAKDLYRALGIVYRPQSLNDLSSIDMVKQALTSSITAYLNAMNTAAFPFDADDVVNVIDSCAILYDYFKALQRYENGNLTYFVGAEANAAKKFLSSNILLGSGLGGYSDGVGGARGLTKSSFYLNSHIEEWIQDKFDAHISITNKRWVDMVSRLRSIVMIAPGRKIISDYHFSGIFKSSLTKETGEYIVFHPVCRTAKPPTEDPVIDPKDLVPGSTEQASYNGHLISEIESLLTTLETVQTNAPFIWELLSKLGLQYLSDDMSRDMASKTMITYFDPTLQIALSNAHLGIQSTYSLSAFVDKTTGDTLGNWYWAPEVLDYSGGPTLLRFPVSEATLDNCPSSFDIPGDVLATFARYSSFMTTPTPVVYGADPETDYFTLDTFGCCEVFVGVGTASVTRSYIDLTKCFVREGTPSDISGLAAEALLWRPTGDKEPMFVEQDQLMRLRWPSTADEEDMCWEYRISPQGIILDVPELEMLVESSVLNMNMAVLNTDQIIQKLNTLLPRNYIKQI